MKEELKGKSLLLLLIIGLFVGLFFINIVNNSYKLKVNNTLITLKDSHFQGVVLRKLKIKGSVKVWFKNGDVRLIYAGYNHNYKHNHLTKFIEVNDSLVKKSDSDTVFIYRQNEKFFFLLNKNVKKEFRE